MTKEEVIEIINNNRPKYLKPILIYRRDNQFDVMVAFIQTNIKCDEELAREVALYFFDKKPKTSQSSAITCPYCKSTNVKKLDFIDRGVSFGLFGFASSKVGKQWHCKNCNSDF